MREFQERTFWRRLFFSRLSFVFLSVLLIFLGYFSVKIYLRSRKAESINNLVEQEIQNLKEKKTELEASVERLQSQEGAEEEIRKKFPVQKPGEETVIIVDEQNKNAVPAPSSSFPSQVWDFIKNLF